MVVGGQRREDVIAVDHGHPLRAPGAGKDLGLVVCDILVVAAGDDHHRNLRRTIANELLVDCVSRGGVLIGQLAERAVSVDPRAGVDAVILPHDVIGAHVGYLFQRIAPRWRNVRLDDFAELRVTDFQPVDGETDHARKVGAIDVFLDFNEVRRRCRGVAGHQVDIGCVIGLRLCGGRRCTAALGVPVDGYFAELPAAAFNELTRGARGVEHRMRLVLSVHVGVQARGAHPDQVRNDDAHTLASKHHVVVALKVDRPARVDRIWLPVKRPVARGRAMVALPDRPAHDHQGGSRSFAAPRHRWFEHVPGHGRQFPVGVFGGVHNLVHTGGKTRRTVSEDSGIRRRLRAQDLADSTRGDAGSVIEGVHCTGLDGALRHNRRADRGAFQ